MSYSIQYDAPQSSLKKYEFPKKRIRIPWALFALVVLLCSMIPTVGGWMRQLVFPGSGEELLSVLEQSIDAIRDGVPVGEAVYAFCSEIISHG